MQLYQCMQLQYLTVATLLGNFHVLSVTFIKRQVMSQDNS